MTSREYLRLIKIDFDNMENVDTFVYKQIGIFATTEMNTAYSKIEVYFKVMAPEKRYLGWDREVYPKYKIEKGELE